MLRNWVKERAGKLAGTLLLLLSVSGPVYPQGGSINTGGITALSATGRPIGGATITVCAFGATGLPCSPTITVYTDPTLGTPATNPGTTDGNGNLFVYAAPGRYTVTVTGPGITGTSYTATVAGSGGGNVVSTLPNTFSAVNTFTQQIVSTVATGTAPLNVASTTNVPNLNASTLVGKTPPAGNIVGDTDAQTLSGKTINGPAGLLYSPIAPTISSGFGTSPSLIGLNGTATFNISIGSGGTATNGVIALPTAANGWTCFATDVTTQSATVFITKQISSGTGSATLANFNTSGAQAAWTANDILFVNCWGR